MSSAANMAAPKYTVWDAFYDILRAYSVDRIFGNPGSTEQPMLKNFPSDIQYIFALQEASVVAMADGYAQATRGIAVCSLHTAAGTGNAMASIMTAFLNKTPLVLIAGQQTRQMLLGDPFLANRQAVELPKPWVKWSYEPVRPQDTPAAIVRAIVTALAAPQGPVYLSIPLDDWDVESDRPIPRTISSAFGPDPTAITQLVAALKTVKSPALVLGPEVDRSLAWDSVVSLAEFLKTDVYAAPNQNRAVFPELHPLWKGPLPPARGPLVSALEGHDFLLVIGAEIWRYYPWVPGGIVPNGCQVVQMTCDPHDASAALVGHSILTDVRLGVEALNLALGAPSVKMPVYELPKVTTQSGENPMTPADVFNALGELRPPNSILMTESPSNIADLLKAWPTVQPESFLTFASGGLGWTAPAAVGVAMAQKGRHTILVIGDGSLHYSVQSIYSAVQHELKLIYIVPRNEEYKVLKEFAVLEDTPNVPALDLIGLDAVAVAKAYGCFAVHVTNKHDLQAAFQDALARDGPSLIEVPTSKQLKPLMGIVKKSHWA